MLSPATAIIGKSLAPSPHGNGLVGRDAHQLAHLEHHAALLGTVDDLAPGPLQQQPGQVAVMHVEHVRAGEVQLQTVAHTLAEEGESARDQQRLQPGVLAGPDESLYTGVELQVARINLLQRGHRHAAQQCQAAAQAVLVVGDLAAHRRLGDGRHLGLAAHDLGDLVDALDV